MMKNKFTLLLFSATWLFVSCGDDLEIPTLAPSFVLDPEIPEVGLPVMFENTTLNASGYSWDFGDDNTSEDISPSHTYEEAGNYDVTLTATAVDGQSVEVTETINVRERALASILITFFRTTNGGEAWDPGEVGTDSLPDIFVLFGLIDDNGSFDPENTWGYPSQSSEVNFRGNDLSIPIDSQFDDIILTNQSWGIGVFDDDGDEVQFIGGAGFNPVLTPSTKIDDFGYFTVIGTDDQFIIFEARLSFTLE